MDYSVLVVEKEKQRKLYMSERKRGKREGRAERGSNDAIRQMSIIHFKEKERGKEEWKQQH